MGGPYPNGKANWGSLKLKWLGKSAEKSSLVCVSGISFQMRDDGPISVNLGVLDMKRFENH